MKRVWPAVLTGCLILGVVGVAGNAVLREREYETLLSHGDRALAEGQTFQAIEAYSGALALRRDSMIAYLKRGEAYRQRGESGAALRDLRAAERLEPAAARPAELLGDVNYDLGRFARAAESYQAFVDRDDRSARVLYKLGLARFRTGDAAGALPPLRQAVALDSRMPEAHYVMGLCLKALGHTKDMAGEFERAVALDGAMVVAREELAAAHALAGRSRASIEQLEAIAALEPNRPERQTVVALAYARAGRTNDAVNLLGRAAERYPDNTSIYLALGRIWLDAAEPRRDRVVLGKAIAALQPLVSRPGISSEVLGLYGRALMLRGDVAAAEPILRHATDTFPVQLETLRWHADASERLGKPADAWRTLERWVALAPESATDRGAILTRLAGFAQQAGDVAAATRALEAAVTTPVPPASAFGTLAHLRLSAGQIAAARDLVARGLSLHPTDRTLLTLSRRLRS